ncbi:MAG: serine protease, partial [Holophagales bacterium]|nr:serine protease [Holophagales bacterium]
MKAFVVTPLVRGRARDSASRFGPGARPRRWGLPLLTAALWWPALAGAQASARQPMELKDLNRQARESVVLLEILGPTGRKLGNGTGFFVEGDVGMDRIATNLHVVRDAHRVEAVLADGSRIAVRGVLASDRDSDLAVLGVDRGSHPPLRLSAAPPAEPGDPVVVVGNPLGLSGTLSTGIVSAVRERGVVAEIDSRFEGAPRIQITAAISPGSSGSPVLDAYGE